MIITDDFIMLNFPKTGSSFCRKIIKDLYEEKKTLLRKFQERTGLSPPCFIELMHKHPFLDAVDQHGTYSDIPAEMSGRKIVSVIRNPLTRYYSDYLYRWWAKYPPADTGVLLKEYANFPNISYLDYYNLTKKYAIPRRLCGAKPKIEIGMQTIQFIYFYFKNPVDVINNIDGEYINNEKYRDDMVDVTFLRQERLGDDLRDFLKNECSFPEKKLRHMGFEKLVNASNKEGVLDVSREDKDFVDSDIIKLDSLIFKIFPEYLPVQRG